MEIRNSENWEFDYNNQKEKEKEESYQFSFYIINDLYKSSLFHWGIELTEN